MSKIIEIIKTFNVQLALKNIYSKIDEIIRNINSIPKPSYKVYTALLNQKGTDAPTAIVLENTLGGDLTWSRSSDGIYEATLSGAFSNQDKFYCTLFSQISQTRYLEVYWNNNDSFGVATVELSSYGGAGVYSDDFLFNQPIEIRVYN